MADEQHERALGLAVGLLYTLKTTVRAASWEGAMRRLRRGQCTAARVEHCCRGNVPRTTCRPTAALPRSSPGAARGWREIPRACFGYVNWRTERPLPRDYLFVIDGMRFAYGNMLIGHVQAVSVDHGAARSTGPTLP